MYYVWRAWRLAGGLPSRRPVGLPEKIPTLWWVRLAAYRLRHPATVAPPLGSVGWGLTSVFDNPRGGIEDVSGMYVRGGVRTVFLNTRNIGWDLIRTLWSRNASTVNPWRRCFTQDDVWNLIHAAGAWGSPGIGINFEPSGPDTTLTIPEIVDALKGYTGNVYLFVSPWMENNQPWKLLGARCVFIIEGFTNEKAWPISDLVIHAHQLGARQVLVMAGVYPASFPPPAGWPEWKRVGGAPIVYLGDNLGADMTKWSAWNPLTP